MKVYLRFGALSPAIAEQLNNQGFHAELLPVGQWQQWAISTTILKIAGMITNAEVDRIQKRITKHITRAIEKQSRLGWKN